MADSLEQQKEIFGKVQGIMAFLDTTDQAQKRENLEAWKETFESLRNITNNPLPFLLELIKNLKAYKAIKNKSSKAKAFRAAKRKKIRGNKTEDGNYKTTKKSFAEKFNLDVSSSPWLSTLNFIIKSSIQKVLPRIDDILYEEIIKAFNCDLSMLVPVVGDGLNGPIVIRTSEIDLLKQLFNDPNSDVGRYMYEQVPLTAYPIGPSPFPVNRFLRELIFNNTNPVFPSGNGPSTRQTIYGASGRPLFDIEVVPAILPATDTLLEIYPYYKTDPDPLQQNYQTAPGTSTGPVAPVAGAQKFNFVELLKDYFENVRLIEMQNLLGALMEILTGFMSVRNKNFNIEDLLGLEKFLKAIENILESCDGADLNEINTESVSHLSELYDDDSFFEFSTEEERNITLEVKRKSQNVITLQSCGSIDIPIDNSIVDQGVNDILAVFTPQQQLAAFDLVLQKASNYSASKAGYDLTLGSISLPVEIDFKENLIKKLPQILAYCIMNPKGVLPIVLTAKLLNQSQTLPNSLEMFMKIFKRVFIRVIKEILAEVGRQLLVLAKEQLLKIIRELIKRKLDEKNKKKIRLIRKLLDILLPLIIALQEAKNCKEIFDALLKALAANMPDIPFGVPPFLVSAAKLRPGTSALGTFERLIGKLQSQGIPVGDMPDGSPNIFLLSQFSLIQSIDDEMTENGAVSSVIMNGQVIHPLGPGLIKPLTQADGVIK
tara:strand:+ start:328 stop:2472 length:2145 start_codon:yes stop_codon:yes gene_type:complete